VCIHIHICVYIHTCTYIKQRCRRKRGTFPRTPVIPYTYKFTNTHTHTHTHQRCRRLRGTFPRVAGIQALAPSQGRLPLFFCFFVSLFISFYFFRCSNSYHRGAGHFFIVFLFCGFLIKKHWPENCMYVCVHGYVYVKVSESVCMCVCMCVCMYVCMNASVYVCMYASRCVCVYVCMYA